MVNQFSRTELLLGTDGMERMAHARVAVFGIGGVGGYTVEALVRSGVGAVDLIDSDTVSLTNLNTTQIFTVSSFEGNIARASILRGSYAILVEGTAQYHDASGKTYIRMFRASTDYVGLEKEGHNEAMLNIIWM